MQRPLWFGSIGTVAAIVLSASCGDGAGSDSDVVMATSRDGVVAVTAPEGVTADGVAVEVTPVAELSPTMAEVAAAGFTVLEYDLTPDGLELEEPITITFTVDRETLGLEEGVLPFALLVSGTDDGVYEGYETINVVVDGDLVTVFGQTTHFSSVTMIVGGESIEMDPVAATAPKGTSFPIKLVDSGHFVVDPMNFTWASFVALRVEAGSWP